ncbi:hypothetical protein [Mitsuaria sp. TWR114]|uniref:hypothetical protein n=1 Tax=Mitsuaria sp. TWR114 TaxID=2601731 RepID=UPI0011BE369F|nr:hypothetical protein [Mitsuaria sp. TWR114]
MLVAMGLVGLRHDAVGTQRGHGAEALRRLGLHLQRLQREGELQVGVDVVDLQRQRLHQRPDRRLRLAAAPQRLAQVALQRVGRDVGMRREQRRRLGVAAAAHLVEGGAQQVFEGIHGRRLCRPRGCRRASADVDGHWHSGGLLYKLTVCRKTPRSPGRRCTSRPMP